MLLAFSLFGATLYFNILWQKDFSPQRFMSNQSINFKIDQVRLTDDTTSLYYKDMIQLLNSTSKDLLFYASYITNDFGMAIYTNNDLSFKPNIIEGRNFNYNDFARHTNTVLISEEYEEFCFELQNQKYFYYYMIHL